MMLSYCSNAQANSVVGYYNWTTNSTFLFNSALFLNCSNERFFGLFGLYDVIKKELNNMTNHNQIEVSFDLLLLHSWKNENFTFKVDHVIYYEKNFNLNVAEDSNYFFECGSPLIYNGTYQRVFKVSALLAHTAPNITLKFQSQIDDIAYPKKYAIKNLEVYIINDDCPLTHLCQSLPFFDCPLFASLNAYSQKCECRGNYYMNTTDFTRCDECDISCMTCNGPTVSNCISCYPNDTLNEGSCIPLSS